MRWKSGVRVWGVSMDLLSTRPEERHFGLALLQSSQTCYMLYSIQYSLSVSVHGNQPTLSESGNERKWQGPAGSWGGGGGGSSMGRMAAALF